MRPYVTSIAAGVLAIAALPAVASAQDAIVTVDLNMRAGPSTVFPVVDVVPGRTPVDVHGCVAGYSWCDVTADNNRGWVYAGYLSYSVQGSYVPLVEYVSDVDLPIISFSVGSYWDSYYRARPWYGERARWRDRWDTNWRGIRSERRDLRVERRIDRSEGRADRRDARVDQRMERREYRFDRRDGRRQDRAERRGDRWEGVQERRVNRVERRGERTDRPRVEMLDMPRQERVSPQSGGGSEDRGRRGRDR
jgi:uncharacterized protein YraI